MSDLAAIADDLEGVLALMEKFLPGAALAKFQRAIVSLRALADAQAKPTRR